MHYRVKYRHCSGNRHYSAYCRCCLLPSVPSNCTGIIAGNRHYSSGAIEGRTTYCMSFAPLTWGVVLPVAKTVFEVLVLPGISTYMFCLFSWLHMGLLFFLETLPVLCCCLGLCCWVCPCVAVLLYDPCCLACVASRTCVSARVVLARRLVLGVPSVLLLRLCGRFFVAGRVRVATVLRGMSCFACVARCACGFCSACGAC